MASTEKIKLVIFTATEDGVTVVNLGLEIPEGSNIIDIKSDIKSLKTNEYSFTWPLLTIQSPIYIGQSLFIISTKLITI